jgi:hypothetical protein
LQEIQEKSEALVAIVRNNASMPVPFSKAKQNCVLFAEEIF